MARTLSGVALAALTAAVCGCGGSSGQPPFPTESAYDTAIIQSDVDVCSTTFTIHRDGTAQRVIDSCGKGTLTTTVPATLVSALFNDLQAAQPFNTLLQCPTVDTSLTVAWNGQKTPNLGACTGSSAAEQTLSAQVQLVETALTPLPPLH